MRPAGHERHRVVLIDVGTQPGQHRRWMPDRGSGVLCQPVHAGGDQGQEQQQARPREHGDLGHPLVGVEREVGEVAVREDVALVGARRAGGVEDEQRVLGLHPRRRVHGSYTHLTMPTSCSV